MARALIVGCGCRGRELGQELLAAGWQVRGTSRDDGCLEAIKAAGIEPALADPALAGTIFDSIGNVGVVVWLLGSTHGEPEVVAKVHGPSLEALLIKLVDSPVRGFAYESVGSTADVHLARGAELVEIAAGNWSIPVAKLDLDRDAEGWARETAIRVQSLLA